MTQMRCIYKKFFSAFKGATHTLTSRASSASFLTTSACKAALLVAAITLSTGALPGLGIAAEAKPAAAEKTSPDTTNVLTMEGFKSPESAVIDPLGRRIYVSNVGEKLAPSTKDGDGFISEILPDGRLLNNKYLPGRGDTTLDAPKGMVILGRTLYVADVDRVVGFDIDSRYMVFELDFSKEKTVFLNDLTMMDYKSLFVSSTDTGNIYKILLGKKPSYKLVAKGIAGVNGLYYNSVEDTLYFVSFGKGKDGKGSLGSISFATTPPTYTKLTSGLGALDGLVRLPGYRFLFSDWGAAGEPGRLLIYDMDTGKVTELKLSTDVDAPADITYDNLKKQILIPAMTENMLLIEAMGE